MAPKRLLGLVMVAASLVMACGTFSGSTPTGSNQPAVLTVAIGVDPDTLDPMRQTTTTVSDAGLYVAILAIGQLISSALLAPVTSAIDVLLYTDLRMRKEGMDIVLGLPTQPVAAAAGPTAVSAW